MFLGSSFDNSSLRAFSVSVWMDGWINKWMNKEWMNG